MSYAQRGLTSEKDALLVDAAYLKAPEVLAAMSDRDRSFAKSLLDQLDSRGLSPRQTPYVHKLAKEARARVQPEQRLTVDLAKINTMLAKAEGMLKRPYILLLADNGGLELRISPAGPTSRYFGQLMVTTAGPYEQRQWLGRIDQRGVYFPALFENHGVAQHVVEAALTELARDPEAKAKAYGQYVGSCCFCSRELTDQRSITAGYGPVCADRYGLAWGTCQEVGA